MTRSLFVPARSSRHRTAALALYRALVRTASRVPLPQDVQQQGSFSPIVQILRKRFAKNKPYTSPRLVYAAMAAGYNFLTLLTKAQTPNSPEHTQIINHLNTVRATSEASRAASRPRRPPPTLPPSPLLINIAKPGESPKYISQILPRPQSSLTRKRKVPILCSTADGQPFVRIKKPQPRALSRMIGSKGKVFIKRIRRILTIDEDLIPLAALEDEWDNLMEDLLRKEKPWLRRRGEYDIKTTFVWSLQLSRLWSEWKVEKTWEDWIARGEAFHDLVEQERALFEQEQGGSPTPLQSPPVQRPKIDGPRPNVGLYGSPPLPLVSAVQSALAGGSGVSQEDKNDPFISPTWQALVKSEQWRMLKWAHKGAVDRNDAGMPEYPWKRPERETRVRRVESEDY